jgi:ABC-type branched-subunit amino acid transport system permease subunit
METMTREARGRRPELVVLFVLCLFALIVLPPFFPTHIQNLMTKILIYTIFAMSLDLLMGYADLPSLGHAAYFGTAAYAAAMLLLHYNFENFWVITLFALIAAGMPSANSSSGLPGYGGRSREGMTASEESSF